MATRIRVSGVGAIVGGILWIIAIVVQQAFSFQHVSSGAGYYLIQVLSTLAFLGFLVGVQGLDWSGAVGAGRFGRRSLRAFELGLVLLILGGISVLVFRSDESPLFPLGGLTIAVASILTGIAAVRAKVLTGWQRYAPLLVGLAYVFGMLVPAFVNSSDAGPPPSTELVWGATWMVLGLAYLLPATGRASTVTATPGLTASRS